MIDERIRDELHDRLASVEVHPPPWHTVIEGGQRTRQHRRRRALAVAAVIIAVVAAVLVPALLLRASSAPVPALPAVPTPRPAVTAAHTPAVVIEEATRLSQQSVEPHAPVEAVWIVLTLSQWQEYSGNYVTADYPEPVVYVIELRSPTPLTCSSCRGGPMVRAGESPRPPPMGRFVHTVIDAAGKSGLTEFGIRNTDPLATLTVYTVPGSY